MISLTNFSEWNELSLNIQSIPRINEWRPTFFALNPGYTAQVVQ